MNGRLNDLQKCQIKILEEIDRVCQLNEIDYFLAYGTCLGAIRHEGFIPWDDDIDICMTIDNLEKFKNCSNDFADNYFIQTADSDNEYGLMIARVRDCNTTLIERSEADRDINHGVFVDVYPLFDCPNNRLKHGILLLHALVYRLFLYNAPPQNKGKLVTLGAKVLLRLVPDLLRKKLITYSFNHMRKYRDEEYVTSLYAGDGHIRYKKNWFQTVRLISFEYLMMPVPYDAEAYLSAIYGDYMKLPPKEKQCIHHDYEFIDILNSYTMYKGIYYCKEKH